MPTSCKNKKKGRWEQDLQTAHIEEEGHIAADKKDSLAIERKLKTCSGLVTFVYLEDMPTS